MKIIKLKRKSQRLILILTFVIFIVGIIVYLKVQQTTNIYVVKKDNFEAIISAKGEIQSKKNVLINFPEVMADVTLNIYQSQIKDLVPEGTVVKKGDYVALLDQSTIKQNSQSTEEGLQKQAAAFNDAKLDSAVSLSTLRDELEQLVFDLRYNQLDVEQSVYDSPANQRIAQIAYDRTARLLDSKRRTYKMRQNEFKIRCARNERQYNELNERNEKYKQAMLATRLTAPGDGMIVYARKWGGRKTRVDDYVSFWDPVIATLPDLTSLVSETYVEEIYISKIHVGDSVRVFVDALKNKEIPATISNISNIGQDMPGFDSNVFKIYIQLTGDFSKLKPSMTTNNEIIIEKAENVLVIPLQCLFTENGTQFVYLKESGNIVRRNLKTGERNDKVIIVRSGLKEKDKILMSKPEGGKI